MEQNKVHLVCSSGGVKCLSYLGAFRKLLANNIEIASVSACSMGSLVGALLCSGIEINTIEQNIRQFNFLKIKRTKSFRYLRMWVYPYAALHTPDYEQIMIELLGKDITLGEMKIPYSAAAFDIKQKKFLVYSSETHPEMKVSEVIRIAMAIPFLFEPYKLDKRLLVDAAVASESPIWMAANNPGTYPILTLKIAAPPNYSYKKGFISFIAYLINASSVSHDYFATLQTGRSIEISINCEQMRYDNFNITRDQIEDLILEGENAMEQKIREYNNNFNHILDIEEIKSSKIENNLENKAELLATQMLSNYQNEIIKRSLVFVSYSRDDKPWLYKLQTALKPIERYSGIRAWDDTLIKPGQEWNKEIEKALVSTKVAVFLVTQHFLASDFIQDKEMKYFLEISQREMVPILWVAVSHCNYDITPLKDIQCVNNPEKPLDTLSEAELYEELTKISKSILYAIQPPANLNSN